MTEDLFIAAVTFGELQAGVELTRRQDAFKAAAIEGWIERACGVIRRHIDG